MSLHRVKATDATLDTIEKSLAHLAATGFGPQRADAEHVLGVVKGWRSASEKEVVIGDYVEDETYGHKGRVTEVHARCPQSESWLAAQSDQSRRNHIEEQWAGVLVHEGGHVVVPVAKIKVIEPFDLQNSWNNHYFKESR